MNTDVKHQHITQGPLLDLCEEFYEKKDWSSLEINNGRTLCPVPLDPNREGAHTIYDQFFKTAIYNTHIHETAAIALHINSMTPPPSDADDECFVTPVFSFLTYPTGAVLQNPSTPAFILSRCQDDGNETTFESADGVKSFLIEERKGWNLIEIKDTLLSHETQVHSTRFCIYFEIITKNHEKPFLKKIFENAILSEDTNTNFTAWHCTHGRFDSISETYQNWGIFETEVYETIPLKHFDYAYANSTTTEIPFHLLAFKQIQDDDNNQMHEIDLDIPILVSPVTNPIGKPYRVLDGSCRLQKMLKAQDGQTHKDPFMVKCIMIDPLSISLSTMAPGNSFVPHAKNHVFHGEKELDMYHLHQMEIPDKGITDEFKSELFSKFEDGYAFSHLLQHLILEGPEILESPNLRDVIMNETDVEGRMYTILVNIHDKKQFIDMLHLSSEINEKLNCQPAEFVYIQTLDVVPLSHYLDYYIYGKGKWLKFYVRLVDGMSPLKFMDLIEKWKSFYSFMRLCIPGKDDDPPPQNMDGGEDRDDDRDDERDDGPDKSEKKENEDLITWENLVDQLKDLGIADEEICRKSGEPPTLSQQIIDSIKYVPDFDFHSSDCACCMK